MTIRGAMDYLAGLSFTGITTNYAVSEWPQILNQADLPALAGMLFPSREGQDVIALDVLTYDQLTWWSAVYVAYFAYFAPVGTSNYNELQPAMVDFSDNFLKEITADPNLDGNLNEQLIVLTIDSGQYGFPHPLPELSSQVYYAVRVTMRWRIKVET